VVAVTSGPTGGAVANAGGAPGVGAGGFGFSLQARAAPASPPATVIDPCFKKSLRDFPIPLQRRNNLETRKHPVHYTINPPFALNME
jgi:hypothetical protein